MCSDESGTKGIAEIWKNLGASGKGAAIGLAAMLPFLPGMLGDRKKGGELRDIYSGVEPVPVHAGRWWEVGSTPFEGASIKEWRPHSLCFSKLLICNDLVLARQVGIEPTGTSETKVLANSKRDKAQEIPRIIPLKQNQHNSSVTSSPKSWERSGVCQRMPSAPGSQMAVGCREATGCKANLSRLQQIAQFLKQLIPQSAEFGNMARGFCIPSVAIQRVDFGRQRVDLLVQCIDSLEAKESATP